MSFEMQYKDDIQKRMLVEVEKINNNAVMEGSFSRDVINANSVEFENAYAEMSLIIQACFGTTAWGDYLTAIASEFGVDRKEAVSSTGTVIIKGNAGSFIPKNSLFAVKNGVQFSTDQAVKINENGTIRVKVTCKTPGSAGNVVAHAINTIPLSISGVHSVDNDIAFTNGVDEETDEELRTRYLAYVREPATSGNVYHYKQWALSVAGVGDVRVTPLAYGPGTVKVLVIDPEKNVCSAETIKKVKDYIESVRPIGATVTVMTPKYKPIDVSAVIYPLNDKNGYSDRIKNDLTNYFIDAGFNSSAVSIAQVGRIILDTGLVYDYDSLKINNSIANVLLTDEELPRLGKLSLEVGK